MEWLYEFVSLFLFFDQYFNVSTKVFILSNVIILILIMMDAPERTGEEEVYAVGN